MKKNSLLCAGLVLAAAAAAGGCARRPPERDALQGVVELHQRVLGFEVGGTLLQRSAGRGQYVKRGDVLAVLDDAVVLQEQKARAADVAQAQAQLDLVEAGARSQDIRAAEADLRAATVQADTLQQEARRTRELRASNATTQQALDEAEGAAQRAEAEREAAEQKLAALRAGSRSQDVRAAQARLDAAKAALEQVNLQIDRYTLRAPIDGLILETHAEPGEVLGVGAPVVTLGEVDRPYVDLYVPEMRIGEVRMGERVQARTDAAPGTIFEGAVEDIGRRTEFTPRYLFSPKERPNLVVRVRVALRDPQQLLRAGLPAFARFVPEGSAR